MKYLLILLTSIIVINAVDTSIYKDQTDNAISSNQPMFYACALGYNLRPGICSGGYNNGVCQGWSRQGSFNNTTVDTLISTTFPKATQAASSRVNFLPPLSQIAVNAYLGFGWDSSGADNMCAANGYGQGT